eukprot:XP_001693658.1 predicted protein [Chlamydomonas reinhardtii]
MSRYNNGEGQNYYEPYRGNSFASHGWVYTGHNTNSRVAFYENSAGVKMDYYYTTGTVKTVMSHPRKGPTQLFRRDLVGVGGAAAQQLRKRAVAGLVSPAAAGLLPSPPPPQAYSSVAAPPQPTAAANHGGTQGPGGRVVVVVGLRDVAPDKLPGGPGAVTDRHVRVPAGGGGGGEEELTPTQAQAYGGRKQLESMDAGAGNPRYAALAKIVEARKAGVEAPEAGPMDAVKEAPKKRAMKKTFTCAVYPSAARVPGEAGASASACRSALSASGRLAEAQYSAPSPRCGVCSPGNSRAAVR